MTGAQANPRAPGRARSARQTARPSRASGLPRALSPRTPPPPCPRHLSSPSLLSPLLSLSLLPAIRCVSAPGVGCSLWHLCLVRATCLPCSACQLSLSRAVQPLCACEVTTAVCCVPQLDLVHQEIDAFRAEGEVVKARRQAVLEEIEVLKLDRAAQEEMEKEQLALLLRMRKVLKKPQP
jgi:hypothetical protein